MTSLIVAYAYMPISLAVAITIVPDEKPLPRMSDTVAVTLLTYFRLPALTISLTRQVKESDRVPFAASTRITQITFTKLTCDPRMSALSTAFVVIDTNPLVCVLTVGLTNCPLLLATVTDENTVVSYTHSRVQSFKSNDPVLAVMAAETVPPG